MALFEVVEWMDDPLPRAGPMNMALDEVLLDAFAGDPAALPLLRVYRWSEPTVSIGYFEPLEPARRSFPALPCVRRWTGGGIVPHGSDLTYSLLVPRTFTPAGWKATTVYNAVHEAIAHLLRTAGLNDVSLTGAVGTHPAEPPAVSGHECFRHPVTHDVMVGIHKVAGAAQRRTRHGLLHQGSVQGTIANGGVEVSLAPETLLHSAIRAGLARALADRTRARRLTWAETDEASALTARRYGTAEWLGKC